MKKIITGVLCLALLIVLLGCPQPVKTDVSYTLTFDSQGGSAVDAASVASGEKAARPTDPVKEGYSFAGWYKETDCTAVWNFDSDIVSADITLYAKWSVNSYTVTFNTNGGSEITSVSADHGSKLTAPTAPTKTGYGFDGWYKEEALTSAWDFDKDTVTAAVTLYAKWKAGSFTISYELNGGINAEANPANYTIETADITLAAPSRTGYTFGGWFEKEDLSGDAVSTIAKGSSGDKKVYAKWTAVTYNIVYELNSGTNAAANPAAYTTETNTITLSAPSRTGYTFGGWFTASDFSGTAVTEITKGSTGEKKVYAKWLQNYSITYNLNSGTNNASNPAMYHVETNTITLASPTRTGYTFGGWFIASDFSGTAVTTIAKGSTGNKVFYAKWGAKIIYHGNGATGTLPVDNTLYSIEGGTGTVLDVTAGLVKNQDGITCIFQEWNTKDDGTGDSYAAAASLTLSLNTILYAQWTVIGGTGPAGGIVFYDNGSVHADGWRYMEAWTEDETGTYKWKTSTTDTQGTSLLIGAGYANTYTAMTGAEHPAAEVVRNATHGGYNDWFLPSREEMSALYIRRTLVGGFSDTVQYWASSGDLDDSTRGWCKSFQIGSQGVTTKTYDFKVRAIRSF